MEVNRAELAGVIAEAFSNYCLAQAKTGTAAELRELMRQSGYFSTLCLAAMHPYFEQHPAQVVALALRDSAPEVSRITDKLLRPGQHWAAGQNLSK
ncbi:MULTISPECIES: hypothetical protein [Pseudomonas]|uniref:Uncharacterized protein n=1 Tax=Pseudomonas quercus TaxID=2722792 RepID=A0ABX0YKM0_9PSED|nr:MULTISPECIES: hypothetical protein [Pseudomonas]MBF7144134.1 hypothetical protein [Pseudomonas sp. LY10J]NJP02734.1 hypothetical protein [Pseudomonas quercus]